MPPKVTWQRVAVLAACLLISAGTAGWIAANAEHCVYRPNEFGICGNYQSALAAMRYFTHPVDLVALTLMGFAAIALGAVLFMLHKANMSLSETDDKLREAHANQTAANLRIQASNIEFRTAWPSVLSSRDQ